MDDTKLYTIGELARRTGLTVKTIRFYSDSGVVPPADRTQSGYRLYDVTAISRLELVRTLRELGAGLDEVRRVLDSQTTLSRLAQANLALVEDQMRVLRTRRAVLRAVVKHDSTTEKVRLMHKLANMSDAERNQLIDEFWDEVTAGLNLHPGYTDWIRSAKPNLPDDPSSEQVEAWIELAELVQDPDFRQAVRTIYRDASDRRDAGENASEQSPEDAKKWWAVTQECRSAYDEGKTVDSDEARDLADRVAQLFVKEYGSSDTPELRMRVADDFERRYDERVEQYWRLLAAINGWPRQPMLGPAATWLGAALRASAT